MRCATSRRAGAGSAGWTTRRERTGAGDSSGRVRAGASVLRYRLTFGPILIALLILAAIGDEWLDALATPGWLSGVVAGETLPPGVLIVPVVVALSVQASREVSVLLRSKGVETARRVNAVLAVAGLAVSAFVPEAWSGVSGAAVINTAVALVLVGSLTYYSRHQRVEGMMAAASGALLAFCYLGLLMGVYVLMRREHPVWVVLWVVMVVKSCDIGAFAVGTTMGRRKLIPWVSPGKTWEGLIGGVATSALVGAGTAALLPLLTEAPVPSALDGAAMGAVFGLVGQVGDLLASMLKRDAGVKDAGRGVPGFGGVLDVIDSPLLVAPVAFWWLRIAVEGAG